MFGDRDVSVNAQYNVSKADSLPARVSAWQRGRMFARFQARCGLPDENALLLDVGVTSENSRSGSNYLERLYPYKHRITAAGIDDARFLEDLYPGLRYVRADALDLPFEDQAFDVVHSAAVLEHVGSFQNQCRMIAECARVTKRFFFLTTPNRWFPVEFHTVLPIVHWLPKPWFRSLMHHTGRSFFAQESNLNLMTGSELLRAASIALPSGFRFHVETEKLLGWPSNLLLIGERRH